LFRGALSRGQSLLKIDRPIVREDIVRVRDPHIGREWALLIKKERDVNDATQAFQPSIDTHLTIFIRDPLGLPISTDPTEVVNEISSRFARRRNPYFFPSHLFVCEKMFQFLQFHLVPLCDL